MAEMRAGSSGFVAPGEWGTVMNERTWRRAARLISLWVLLAFPWACLGLLVSGFAPGVDRHLALTLGFAANLVSASVGARWLEQRYGDEALSCQPLLLEVAAAVPRPRADRPNRRSEREPAGGEQIGQ